MVECTLRACIFHFFFLSLCLSVLSSSPFSFSSSVEYHSILCFIIIINESCTFFFRNKKRVVLFHLNSIRISNRCVSLFRSLNMFFSFHNASWGLVSLISNNIVKTLLDHKIDRRSHHFVSALCFSLTHSHIEPVFMYVVCECVRKERWMIYIQYETKNLDSNYSLLIELKEVLLFLVGPVEYMCLCV